MKADSKVISQLNESSSTIHKTVEREMNYIEVCGHYNFLNTKDVLNDEITLGICGYLTGVWVLH